MGYDYLGNDLVGKQKHIERMNFEINLIKENKNDLKRNIYQNFAKIGIGRTAIIYAQLKK